MSNCAGVFGKWCVWAILPTYTPQKIRYRYPGENWQEIVGDSYTITINPPQLGQVPGKRYLVYLDCNLVFEGGQSYVSKYGRSLFYDVLGPVGGLIFVPSNDGFNQYRVGVQGSGPINLRPYYDASKGSGTGWAGLVGGLWGRNWKIIDIVPQNGIQDPLESTCTFKIFSTNNSLLFESTRSVCPEAIVVPEACEFKPENKRQVGEWFNVFTRNMFNPIFFPYAQIEQDLTSPNCVRVFVVNPLNPLFKLELTYVCSDCPDRPPIVWVECPCDDCRDKKCPPGTVYRLLEGNNLLCLDERGCVLSSVPYDPKCEQPNCSCN